LTLLVGKHHQAQDASFSTPWLHDTRANDNQDELSLTGFSKDTPFSYSKSIGSLKRFDSPPTESTQMSRNAVTSGYNSTLHQVNFPVYQ
jgi:hypothetical protein